MRKRNWYMAGANFEPERPIPFVIERDGKRIELAVTLRRGSFRDLYFLNERGVAEGQLVGFGILTIGLALIVAFRRPHDPLARFGAWYMASLAFAVVPLGYGLASAWRHLPVPLGILLWPGFVTQWLLGAIALTFGANFPRRLFRAMPWVWGLIWIPAASVTALLSLVYAQLVYRPLAMSAAPGQGNLLFIWQVLILCYGLITAIVWVVSYRRLTDLNERRRLRVLLAGTLVLVLAATINVILLDLAPAQVSAAFRATPLPTLLFWLFLVYPLSFAYAILRHRILDLGLILRQGLQYALARRLLVSAVPVLAAIFLADLLMHGNQSVLAVFQAKGWMYAALAVLAAVAYTKRKSWLEALDRRFFRDQYDARWLLREIAEEVRGARSLEEEAPRVVAGI